MLNGKKLMLMWSEKKLLSFLHSGLVHACGGKFMYAV